MKYFEFLSPACVCGLRKENPSRWSSFEERFVNRGDDFFAICACVGRIAGPELSGGRPSVGEHEMSNMA